jgi:hypothetical protein
MKATGDVASRIGRAEGMRDSSGLNLDLPSDVFPVGGPAERLAKPAGAQPAKAAGSFA